MNYADGQGPADSADDFPYKDLSYQVIGLLYKVQNDLGTKFQEKHYQKALAMLLDQTRIPYKTEAPIEVHYEGKLLGKFRLDFVIDQKIILELKVADYISTEHRQQMIRYLESANMPVGLIVNFRVRPIKILRVVNSKSA